MRRPSVLLGALVLLAAGCGSDDRAPQAQDAAPRDCASLTGDPARECYVDAFTARVTAADDALAEVEAITAESRAQGGFLLTSCHGIMHTVGRAYAAERTVGPESLMEHLPRSNDPGCPAGFAHGVVTTVAPKLDLTDPARAASVCAEGETRYERYSCTHGFGHAFMRVHGDRLEPALELCRALGAAAPDCAQGAYHDYWFAVAGLDDAERPPDAVTDPRELCAAQPEAFVRPCWYRAFVDNRPAGAEILRTSDLTGLCEGLAGLQREGCLTAASVIGPADPRAQMILCSGLRGPDALACVRGVKVQNLLDRPEALLVEVVAGCERIDAAVRAGCYRRLGKTSAVLTDGAFESSGCPRLPTRVARRACAEGARALDGPLETFS